MTLCRWVLLSLEGGDKSSAKVFVHAYLPTKTYGVTNLNTKILVKAKWHLHKNVTERAFKNCTKKVKIKREKQKKK